MSREQPQLTGGLGDGLAMAFELVATPLVFVGIGWLIDRWADSTPLFMVVLGLLALIGKAMATWYRYTGDMERHAARLPGAAPAQGEATIIAMAAPVDLDDSPDGRLPAGISLDAPRERGR